jgi:hypothetical protein
VMLSVQVLGFRDTGIAKNTHSSECCDIG